MSTSTATVSQCMLIELLLLVASLVLQKNYTEGQSF